MWWLLLGIVPVMLYLFRRRSKRVRVSTLVFFKTLAQEHQESAWLRRIKKWVSFLLTIALLVLSVFVLSRLIVKQDDADQYRTVILLLDRSASMAVQDESGESRMDAAKRLLTERLKKVPEEVGVALIAYDVRPEVLQARTLKRRELLSRLDTVRSRPIPGRTDTALEAARMLAGLEPPAAIWHVSDQLLPRPESLVGGETTDLPDTPVALPDGIALRELNLALPEISNAGITALQLRPVPLEHSRYDAYVEIALNTDAPDALAVRLNVSVGGIPSQLREVELAPGEKKGLTFRLDGASDQILRVWLESDNDLFPLDDQVLLPLPEVRPIVAAWIRPDAGEDPYTRLALSSIQESGSFELLKGGPSAWPLREKVDAVIFDGWLPPEWPADIPAVVINPPASSGPLLVRKLDAAVPYGSVGVGNEDHPVLFRISSSRVAVTQTAVFETQGGLEPLWTAGREPVLAAGEINGQRIVVMAFSPGLSERLPLTASFPLLMGNSLFWCVGREDGPESNRLFSTGELAPVSGESILWTGPAGNEGRKQRAPLHGDVVEMDRIGMWETDTGVRGASHLLSVSESDIRALGPDGGGDPDYFLADSGIAGNLKAWLLGALSVILLLESWLFHRHAVY
ncbi:MAG: VWA domain-containing protein [Verrucomicrobiaceae bacterium]|nr:VWA domain-containing protein [Verrucomicrobiaceae bacterium]